MMMTCTIRCGCEPMSSRKVHFRVASFRIRRIWISKFTPTRRLRPSTGRWIVWEPAGSRRKRRLPSHPHGRWKLQWKPEVMTSVIWFPRRNPKCPRLKVRPEVKPEARPEYLDFRFLDTRWIVSIDPQPEVIRQASTPSGSRGGRKLGGCIRKNPVGIGRKSIHRRRALRLKVSAGYFRRKSRWKWAISCLTWIPAPLHFRIPAGRSNRLEVKVFTIKSVLPAKVIRRKTGPCRRHLRRSIRNPPTTSGSIINSGSFRPRLSALPLLRILLPVRVTWPSCRNLPIRTGIPNRNLNRIRWIDRNSGSMKISSIPWSALNDQKPKLVVLPAPLPELNRPDPSAMKSFFRPEVLYRCVKSTRPRRQRRPRRRNPLRNPSGCLPASVATSAGRRRLRPHPTLN